MYMLDLVFLFYGMLILIVCVLIGVAFLTLLERKVLGYIQLRKGPNKVGFLGVPQPFSDAIKLFTKEQTYPLMSNYGLYYASPVFNLFLSLLIWLCIPLFSGFLSFSLGILYFLCCASLSVYTVMLAGWSSNSNYSMLGSMRAVAQTISYEVSLALTLLSFLILIMSLNLVDLKAYQSMIWFIVISLPLCMVWFVSSLAETNRTPFDFAEGESELVSGFNVEYSGGGFALIFLAEYSSILFMSMMCCMLFLGANFLSFLIFFLLGFMSFLWVWVRGTLPRFRYDKLMYLAWKSYLPLSLNYFLFFLGLKMFVFTWVI
uniref:NADH-ubiquinone oxidoreductase chain 1 n=2 Tax=Lucaninae TaxID=614534 RepID=A0A5J6NCV0_9SCAR|nr:NADH dehydrogenase subunit 1 [Velutinodorcus velutinus]YP_009709676.1 NADH dehydrogenase subunit 1 [Dorcus ursulus]QEX51681.1 NADH dehydrogenase subunit 1 [Velutinodorcus velutinus]QEX51695.1 NADH dehydrogenase subunit 1 [Dorcus ursulus]